jgi:uncharacterized membrane protein YfcA
VSGVEILGFVAIGVAAGLASGLIGVGGGILFVPGLVLFLDKTQIAAEATSLVAIVVVSAVGAWRQRGYGNFRPRDAVLVGVLSPFGVVAGTVLANALSERALELSFAAVQVWFAVSLARRALRPPPRPSEDA